MGVYLRHKIMQTSGDNRKENEAAGKADSDAMLMLEAAGGSEHALRMIIEKWKTPLINFFYRSVHNAHTAEDLSQKTFINLYRARTSYEPKSKFSTYLFHIARTVLINEYRQTVRRPADATDPMEMPCPAEAAPRERIAELEEIFEKTLETLPENQRTAILLLKQQDLSYEQIAAVMKTTPSSVKTWIHRARIALKEALKKS